MKALATKELDFICKKLALRILPLIVLMFSLCILDRTNLSFVKSHIQIDVGISEAAYALGAGIFFIAYALFEVPSNLFLYKFGAKIWLSRIMISWGLVTMAMSLIQGEISFYILRFLLGLSEAGFSPGIILYLSYFFPPHYRSKAYGIYQMAVPLAFIFGSLISGAILAYIPEIHFKNWQWLFIIQGAFTIGIGIFAYFYLSSSLDELKYLNTNEKEVLKSHLQTTKTKDYNIKQSLKQQWLWAFVFVYFCVQFSVYGVIFYLPSKIAAFLDTNMAFIGFLNALPWLCVFFALPIITKKADKKLSWNLYALYLLFLAALSLFFSSLTQNLIIFLFLMSLASVGFIVVQPLFWNLVSLVFKGKTKAFIIAFIGSLGNLGGFVAPSVKTYMQKSFGEEFGFISLAFVAFLGTLMLYYLKIKLNLDGEK